MRQMYVIALGLRGFPGVQGGIEVHAEHLYPRLVELGCDVEVITRSPYASPSLSGWRGVRFRRLWAPRWKILEAPCHSLLGVLYAAWRRPDILHIHAIGPALVVPLACLLGLRVVVTHHGPDYERAKWGRLARLILRLGERLGMQFADQRIAISEGIACLIQAKYGLDAAVIPNGVVLPDIPDSTGTLEHFGLKTRRYIIQVGRLVPEKRHLDLIAAFEHAKLDLQGWNLVIVGEADHPDRYSQELKSKAAQTPGVVLTGFQSGLALGELYAHAGLFVLPSSHEGLPIAVLESLSYGVPALVSDIPAHLELGLDAGSYFELGNVRQLAAKLRELAERRFDINEKRVLQQWVIRKYDWKRIAEQTVLVYSNAFAA
jgi:glycosyltransferase involved in cell wall biosynthesis